MKLLATLILSLSLTGCAHFWKPERDVVVEQVYVVRIPPAETMKLPAPVPNLDVSKATQGDVAKWLVKKEDYTTSLEDKLKSIAKFFVDEQKKLEKK